MHLHHQVIVRNNAYTGYDGLVYMRESNPKGKGTLLKSVSSRASGVWFRDPPLPPKSNLLVIRDFNPKLTSAPRVRAHSQYSLISF